MRFTDEQLLSLGYPPDMLATAKSGTSRPKPIGSFAGVKILATRIGPDPVPASYDPGATIVEFRLADVRPVPWSVSRRGRKSPKLSAFQRAIHAAAVVAMAGRPPYAGPVSLHATFRLISRGSMPDLTNLEKGTEDALQAGVFINDSQVRAKRTEYDPEATADGVWIRVTAFIPSDLDRRLN
jgi:Holliday junction resolvase RusA-like endonuclease